MKRVVLSSRQFGVVQCGILLLALLTAFAHLYLGTRADEELHVWFTLNGLGYIALLAAFFLSPLEHYHTPLRWLFMGYTLLTIVLWFFLSGAMYGELDPFDITIKGIELALVVLLLVDSRQAHV